MAFAVGDIVKHRILGREKVVVGMGEDRCLCAYREDIQQDGHLRPNARVALHRQESLHRIGHYGEVVPISLNDLYGKELKQKRWLHRRNLFREEVVPYFLFLVASALIVLALLSALGKVHSYIDTLVSRKADQIKTELIKEKLELMENRGR